MSSPQNNIATPEFFTALSYLFSQKSTISELYLKPINTIVLLDTNGNTVSSTNDLTVQYSNGVVTVVADFVAQSTDTITTALVGNTFKGVFTSYFSFQNLSIQVTQGNLYSVTLTIVLNNLSVSVSVFNTPTVTANKLIDVIGNILSGNPLYTGKSGQFFDAIYIVNTTSNVSQSYRVPITIATVSPTLMIGGILPSTVYGNQIVLRDSNQNDLLIISGKNVHKFKQGRQIIIEFTF